MIDHKYKCIFIHLPKTGGSSVETLFNWKGQRHDTLQDYVNNFGENVVRDYFKFSLVRNPWDMMVSWYFFHGKTTESGKLNLGDMYYPKNKEGFLKWIKGGMDSHWNWINSENWRYTNSLQNSSFIKNKQNINLDFIGKFENLGADVRRVCSIVGLPLAPLPHTNKSQRKDYYHYYNHMGMDIIKRKYFGYIKDFGYSFNK